MDVHEVREALGVPGQDREVTSRNGDGDCVCR